MNRIYRESDVSADGLNALNIVVVGYGSQGRAQALNLRDSGVNVAVSLRRDGATWQQARGQGWDPIPLEEAATGADIVCLLAPDMVQPEIYDQHFRAALKPGATLLFAHGFNVHFKMLEPADSQNIVMVAPKGPGSLVRREFVNGSGVPCLVAVERDVTGDAGRQALAYADAIGGTRAAVIETTFAEETETDLFGEQAVLCGGATELVVAGWETLVEEGYSPEIAYFECLHELKLIVDLLYEGGLAKMHQFVSDTAKYGDLTRGPRVINAETRHRMKETLAEIKSGAFAKEWRDEYQSGASNYRTLLQKDLEHPIEETGKRLREHFAWIQREQEEVTA